MLLPNEPVPSSSVVNNRIENTRPPVSVAEQRRYYFFGIRSPRRFPTTIPFALLAPVITHSFSVHFLTSRVAHSYARNLCRSTTALYLGLGRRYDRRVIARKSTENRTTIAAASFILHPENYTSRIISPGRTYKGDDDNYFSRLFAANISSTFMGSLSFFSCLDVLLSPANFALEFSSDKQFAPSTRSSDFFEVSKKSLFQTPRTG